MSYIICLILTLMTSISAGGWQSLAPGIDYRIVKAEKESAWGNSEITVVRIDPKQWELVYAGIDKKGEEPVKTALQWCEALNLTGAINAGMFNDDGRTHTGYARYRDRVMSNHTNSYKSVAAFDPKPGKSLPPFRIYDIDKDGVTLQSVLADYGSAVQNLRLIKKPGVNVWSPGGDTWSEVALGEDDKGNILFIFSLSPFNMHDLNNELLKGGIGIVAAQHLEGGGLAQLYLNAGDTELDLSGNGDDAWEIPNIIGIRRRAPSKAK